MLNNANSRTEVKSFETAEGDRFGDLLSADRIETHGKLKIGLLWTGFFEYWPMYPQLKGQIEQDGKVMFDRLSGQYDIVDSGMVDTIDAADQAGRLFRDKKVDLVILAYRTYVPDTYMHQMLSHLPQDLPLLVWGCQSRDRLDYDDDYSGLVRNSGLMALVQLICGFKKIAVPSRPVEAVAGTIYDNEAYEKIGRYIDVVTIHKRLKTMTIGVIGHVFRGMFDFEFDKAKVKGVLGPEVMNIQIEHLADQLGKAPLEDDDVQATIRRVRGSYRIRGVGDADLANAARVAVALRRLVQRFRIDAVALLGQHFIEKKVKTTPFLGLAQLSSEGFPGVTEGDVIGLIMMEVLHHLTGNMAYLFEWSEFVVDHNAWMLVGHGFGDPTQARNDEVILTPSAEQWGLEGTGCSTMFVPKPGPCTMAHFVHHADGWRMFISGGELLDLDPLPVNDVHAFVQVDRPIKEHAEMILKAGIPHHAITVRGDVRPELRQLAELLRMPVLEV